jgi:hypothetical protein
MRVALLNYIWIQEVKPGLGKWTMFRVGQNHAYTVYTAFWGWGDIRSYMVQIYGSGQP